MKRRLAVLFLLSCLLVGLFAACGKEEKTKEGHNLPKEFTLRKSESEEEADILEPFIFDEVISAAKIMSISHDSTGSSLGYILKEEDLENFIRLFQEAEIRGEEVTKEVYQAQIKSALSGYIIEFLDSSDQFSYGVARISCLTNTNKYYLNSIEKKGSRTFRIEMPDRVVDFLNEKSKENYFESSPNPGWFDKAFKK